MIFDPASLPSGFPGALMVLFAFLVVHAVADFGLQGPFLAQAKNRGADLSAFFGETPPPGVWVHALTAHSLIHAGGIWLVSGSVVLGAIELVLHWVIDFAKSGRLFGFHVDQGLHIACKLGYVAALYYLPPGLM